MNFCPIGTSIITFPNSGSGPITVPLTGLDPNNGIIRVLATGASDMSISFGNGDILLAQGGLEFFKVPDGVTSVDVKSNAISNVRISVTIGEFA